MSLLETCGYKNLNKVILGKCLSALADIIQEYVWVFIWNGSFKHAVYLGLWFKSFFFYGIWGLKLNHKLFVYNT